MTPRLDMAAAAPATLRAMLALSAALAGCSIEKGLQELVKIRASQINGCAFCLHMHTADALKSGETAERLFLLAAWREAPCFTSREQAALAWTEALTLVAETHAPDTDYAMLAAQFSAEEQVDLTALIGLINSWNRLAIGFRSIPAVRQARAA